MPRPKTNCKRGVCRQSTGRLQPSVRLGAALMFHHLQAISPQVSMLNPVIDLHGRIPMTLLGAGLCYKQVCADTTYYHGLGGPNCLTPCGLPISKEMLVTLFTVKIPL